MKKRKKKHTYKGLFVPILVLLLCSLILGILIVYPGPDIHHSVPTTSTEQQAVPQQKSVPGKTEQKKSPVQTREKILPEKLEIPVYTSSENALALKQSDQSTSAATEITQTEQNVIPDYEIHQYTGFSLCYRETYEQPDWVAYELTKDELKRVEKRSDDFRSDPKITTGSASPSDYIKSGYDKGHLAPAADMEYSTTTIHESFLMSNMSPQAPAFNRGIWKYLEADVRTWADIYGRIYVISGPVLEKPASSYKHIGKNKVTVPEFFYKVLLAQEKDGTIIAIGFLLPNKADAGSIFDYAVPIDEIEARTHLDFFSLLPDPTENNIEKSVIAVPWENTLKQEQTAGR